MGVIASALRPREERGLTATEAIRRLIQSTTTRSGVAVNEQNAMQLMAVFTAVKILSEAFAQVPLKVYRRRSDGSREEAREHPLFKVLHDQPNAEMTSFTLREVMLGHIALWGNSYCEISRNFQGDIIGLWPLLPNKTKPYRTKSGALVYLTRVQKDPASVNAEEEIVLPARNVLHTPGFGFDGLKGLSVIGTVREGIGLAFAYEAFGSYFFGNNTVPGLTLTTDQPMKKEQVDELERRIREGHEGLTNSQRLMILTSGLKPVQVGMPLEDAQFLEQRKFTRSEIFGLYRIAPHLSNDGDKVSTWGTGIEQMSIGHVVYTMLPYFKRFEQSMNMRLFGANAQAPLYPEFDPEGFLRGDYKTRMEGYAIGRQWGWYSVNDIKRRENEPTIGSEGDIYLSPSGYIPADRLGEVVDKQVEPEPAPTAPTDDKPEGSARSHRHALADVTDRILRREQQDVSRGIERLLKKGTLEDVPAWLEGFYKEHREWAAKQAAPVFAGIAESVGARDGHLVLAAATAFVERLCSESMDGLRRAIRGETQLDRILAAWEGRAQAIAEREVTLAAETFGGCAHDPAPSITVNVPEREVNVRGGDVRVDAPVTVQPAEVRIETPIHVGEQPAPIVNLTVPDRQAIVNLTVPEQPAPVVNNNVTVPERSVTVNVPEEPEIDILRDKQGLVTGTRKRRK